MQNADIIRTGISYIEQNLKTDITPEELANMAGYSVGTISVCLHRRSAYRWQRT